jgi:hypothetical protein
MGGSDQRNRTVDGAGEVKLLISASDVRFRAHSGLKADIAPGPKCAKTGSRNSCSIRCACQHRTTRVGDQRTAEANDRTRRLTLSR